ncbi:hypothetical protein ACH4JZ_18420 [Streptomyces sp. NPDC017615]|uniref:hypothetical protein n=1 Tax=Streptomyces sp. NPDC017615 TaxID=3365003 RepID=UPI00378BC7B1
MNTPSTTAADLAAIREQWGDLLAAIERPPADQWPPREARGFLDQLAAADHHQDDDQDDEPRIGRTPLTLREHPAPLNLDALDAALAVERDLFDLADTLAAAVQRPVHRYPAFGMAVDQEDQADPSRWHLPTHRSATLVRGAGIAGAGSRAHGLHWAAVWIEGRVLGEDLDRGLFTELSPRLLDEAAAVARRARATVERALHRDGRATVLDTLCPWCAGVLSGRTRGGGEPYVTCGTGAACEAPVNLDGRWRTWRGAELVALWSAMQAAREREEAAQAA